MDDVLPFLENVLRGRNVPRERMLQVARHYELFGGVSPLNQQNRNLIAALHEELKANGPHLPIYWGNRNWHPFLTDALKLMVRHGIKHALAFVTSAYSSFSSCRQYLQNIADARTEVGVDAPLVDKLRPFYNHPLFIEANVEQVRIALGETEECRLGNTRLVFTAHSIPLSMAANCEYENQLAETARLIAEQLGITKWQVVYQSRSGSPQQPWLGPDVSDYLKQLSDQGVTDVVIAPIGFVSDHMEVIYDLDVRARQVSREVGLKMTRAATAGTHPKFTKMIRELILERTDELPARFCGSYGPRPNICAVNCCLPGSNSESIKTA